MPIFPVDLFGRSRAYSRYPKVFDLKVNMPSGIYDVVAVTNWGEAPSERTVTFGTDLGLNTARSYVVFDFWEQKLIGTYQDDFTIPIPSHGTRVIAVHPNQIILWCLGQIATLRVHSALRDRVETGAANPGRLVADRSECRVSALHLCARGHAGKTGHCGWKSKCLFNRR